MLLTSEEWDLCFADFDFENRKQKIDREEDSVI
jgi:hypothetical protein